MMVCSSLWVRYGPTSLVSSRGRERDDFYSEFGLLCWYSRLPKEEPGKKECTVILSSGAIFYAPTLPTDENAFGYVVVKRRNPFYEIVPLVSLARPVSSYSVHRGILSIS